MATGNDGQVEKDRVANLTTAQRLDCLVRVLSEKETPLLNRDKYEAALGAYGAELKEAETARKHFRDTALKGTTDDLQGNIRKVVMGIVIVFTLAVLTSIVLLASFQPKLDPSTMALNPGTLLSFLGFIVALAAYLATVARALKDKLTELKDKPIFDAAPIEKHAKNLIGIIRAEALLVSIGVLTMGRILIGPLRNFATSEFDYFLLVYMVFIILYLGYLHAKQWTYTSMI
jgi:hypothetical protein